jgi:hypothetical protein
MRADYQYFEVRELPLRSGRKLPQYELVNKRSGERIGLVEWYGAWRQFVFCPEECTVWSVGCLMDVREVLGAAAKAREEADK